MRANLRHVEQMERRLHTYIHTYIHLNILLTELPCHIHTYCTYTLRSTYILTVHVFVGRHTYIKTSISDTYTYIHAYKRPYTYIQTLITSYIHTKHTCIHPYLIHTYIHTYLTHPSIHTYIHTYIPRCC